jgi:hypothetical protein
VIPVDRRLCGLPYRDDATKPYAGAGPRFTVARLRHVADEIKQVPPDSAESTARMRLGTPDDESGGAWLAIGARGDAAPITCHALVIDGHGAPHIEPRDLEACGVAWPPPREAFVRDETVESPVVSATSAECAQRCTTNDVCMVRRTTEKGAMLVQRDDDLFAFRLDGRPSRIDLSTKCVPIPASCSTSVTFTCIVSQGAKTAPSGPPNLPPANPCATPDEDATGFTFARTPSGLWTLTCTTRKKTA